MFIRRVKFFCLIGVIVFVLSFEIPSLLEESKDIKIRSGKTILLTIATVTVTSVFVKFGLEINSVKVRGSFPL